MPDSCRAGDNHIVRQPQEQAMFNDPGTVGKPTRKAGRILDRPEPAIQDQIVLVGAKMASICTLSNGNFGAERCQKSCLGLPPVRQYLDRQAALHPNARRHFAFIDDDYLPSAGLGDDFFPQQRPTASLYEVQFRIHFVCTVD